MSNLQMRKKFDMIQWNLIHIIIQDYFQSQNIQFLKLSKKKKISNQSTIKIKKKF
jgi:hypothetical protein